MAKIKTIEFMKMKPSMFAGESSSDDSQRFLDDCEKILYTLECPKPRRVTLVTFQLRGRAEKWWRTWKKGLASSALPIDWKEL